MTEKNKILLFNLLKEKGNEQCAECGETGSVPDWASENLGVFLCVDCSGKHRSLGKQISFVRSLRLDNWADDKCEFMAKTGNLKSNAVYEKNVPACWRRPTPFDHHLEFYVEEWIRAKYERKEFMEGNESKQTYCQGTKDGLLMKKERHGNKWNSRYFRLSAETGSLSYYNKKEDLSPIKRMDIKQVNVILCSDKKTDKFFSMEITAPEEKEKKGKIKKQCERSIYVHAESGKDIVDWFLSIRAAKLKALNLDESDPNISRLLSRDYIKEGFVKKSGPKENDRYIQRWITVEPNKFSYFTNVMDPTPKKEVKLRPSPELYSVAEGVDGKHPDEPHPFMVQTPERVFNFGAESKEEMENWMRAFKKAIETEPLDQNRNDRMSVVSAVSQLSISSSDSAGSS